MAVRQMHDLGSFAVRVTAPLLARVLKADGDSYETGLHDVRTYGLKRPEEADDVPIANVIRCLAWLALTLTGLALFIVASFARVGPPAVNSALEVVMTALAVVGFTIIGMMLTSLWRYILSKAFFRTLRARLDDNPAPKPGLAGWLTIPNSVDIVPALLFMVCFAPPVFPLTANHRADAPESMKMALTSRLSGTASTAPRAV